MHLHVKHVGLSVSTMHQLSSHYTNPSQSHCMEYHVCVCVCCIQSLHKNAMRDKKCCDQLSSSATQMPLAGQTAFHCVSVSVQVSTNQSSQLDCCRVCTSSHFSKRSCTFCQQHASCTHATTPEAWFKPHTCGYIQVTPVTSNLISKCECHHGHYVRFDSFHSNWAISISNSAHSIPVEQLAFEVSQGSCVPGNAVLIQFTYSTVDSNIIWLQHIPVCLH